MRTDKKLRSLRVIVLVFLGAGFVLVGSVFFVVFHTTMPAMLLQSENTLLDKQQRSLHGLFDAAMRYTYQMADDTAQWDETAAFAEGRNPDFIAKNWHDATPLQNYRFNFMLVKNGRGDTVYEDWYDYRANTALSAAEGFSDYLGQWNAEVLERHRPGQVQNTAPQDRGRGGVFIYQEVAYSLAAMPILSNSDAASPSGVLYLGNILDDAYFKDITKFDTIQFATLDGTDQTQIDDYAALHTSRSMVTTTLAMPSLTGKPVLLSMSDTRTLYLHGMEMLNKTIILLLATLLLFAAVLYFTARRFVLRPMDVLGEDISRINAAQKLDRQRYSHSLEFSRLCASINDMTTRLNKSTTAMGVLRKVLDGMDSFIYVVDQASGSLLFVNDTLREYCRRRGIHVSDQSKGACWQVLHRGLSGPCEGCQAPRLAEEQGQGAEWEHTDQESGRHYRNIDRVINWVDGSKAHLHHCMDVTANKNAEAAIVRAKEQAEESSRAKSDFLSRMSHEMRTPLNAVIGMTHIAKASSDPQKKEYCLNKIDEASTHLLGVINDILDMSKIEADKFELLYAPCCFADMLRRVSDVVSFRVEEKSQNFTLHIEPSMPACMETDEQHLAQVITNLLANAVKFTPAHGDITLTARSLNHDAHGQHTLQIEVSDSGIGISPEHQGRLFSSFEQADGGIARKFGGTGLGLAISKRIVEMMGGKIWIESEEGKGATFLFTFQAKALTADQTESPAADQAAALPVQDPTRPGAFAGRRVLLAEDNDVNREIVLSLLEESGLVIDTAADGKEAVEAFTAAPDSYDAIFMDIHMPEVDGYEATRRIRSLPLAAASAVPVIAMTANVFREDIERCLASGMNDHIGKPINPAELYQKLTTHLSARSYS